MIKKLFFFSFLLLSVAPIISYLTIFSNFNIGDVIFILLSPFILSKNKKIEVWHFIPFVFCFIYLFSSFSALFFYDAIADVNIGFSLRFLYYFFVVLVIYNYIDNKDDFIFIVKAVYLGLVATLALAWVEWLNYPTYLGSIPMLHTVHGFEHFPINRNYIGFFIALGAGLSFSFFIYQKDNKALFFLIFIFFIVSSLLTFSKGTWLSSCLFVLFFCFKRKPFLSLFTLFFFILFVVFLYVNGFEFVYDLVEKIIRRIEGSDRTNDERLMYAFDAISIASDYFPFGVGAEGYYQAALNGGYNLTKDPHNTLLWIFSESGFFGLTLFVFTVGFIFLKIYLYRSHRECILLLGLFIPLLANIPFQGTPFSMKYLWVLLGLILSLKFLLYEKNSTRNNWPSASRS